MGRISRGGLYDLEQRPDIGAPLPASLTGKLRLQIGKPDAIGPLAGCDRDMVGAAIVCAVDQQSVRAGRPHFAEGDLLLVEHGP